MAPYEYTDIKITLFNINISGLVTVKYLVQRAGMTASECRKQEWYYSMKLFDC